MLAFVIIIDNYFKALPRENKIVHNWFKAVLC